MKHETIRFSKMQGTGNDYIYIDCLKKRIDHPEKLAKALSDRHFGVGADGLILICPSRKADFAMEMYNADGSSGEMCGNGIRCLGKYVFDRGRTDKTALTVETRAGLRFLRLFIRRGQKGRPTVERVQVDMGSPMLSAEKIPVISENSRVVNEPISVNGAEYRITGVSMGNPHAVVFVKNIKGIDIEWLGPSFEYHGRFPRRVNTEFAEVQDSRTIKARVWERGSGETLSCGTGACAAAVAGVLNNLTERQVTVQLKGGDLFVDWREDTDTIWLEGPAVHVFDGEI